MNYCINIAGQDGILKNASSLELDSFVECMDATVTDSHNLFLHSVPKNTGNAPDCRVLCVYPCVCDRVPRHITNREKLKI